MRGQQLIAGCLEHALRPLVRLSLRNSFFIKRFIEVLKNIYVDEAARALEKSGKKPNVSRISLMTGLHRIDVTKIYRDESPARFVEIDLLARVVQNWEQLPEFRTKNGKPRVLGLTGEPSEFDELLESVGNYLNPGTLLFELERSGLIERTARGIKLSAPVHRFDQDPTKGFELLGKEIETFINTVERNVQEAHLGKQLHIRTEYNNIAKQDVEKVRKWFITEGAKFHRKARAFLSKHDLDVTPNFKKEGGIRASITSFSFIHEQETPTNNS